MKYRSGYKYQLWEDESLLLPDIILKDGTVLKAPRGYNIETQFIRMEPNGRLTGKTGYAWDGPSGPTIDTKNSMRAALVHDAGYQLMREGYLPLEYKGYFDELFFNILREDGMSWIRAIIWLRAVQGFGKQASLPENDRPILEAP